MFLAGCQTLDPLSPPTPEPTTSRIPPEPDTTGNPDLPLASSSGRLAYIGGDGNVYVTTADGASTIAVTDDATVAPEGNGLSYHRLAWSPDGRLAFASVARSGSAARSKLYVAELPGGPTQVVGRSDEHFVIYIYWSPLACPDRPTCRRLAYLIEEEDGVGLHVVEMDAGTVDNRLVDTGRLFYFSWSANGRQLLWHTGGSQRYDPDARIALHTVGQNRVQRLPQAPGLFHAPAWSPTEDRWLGVVADDEVDRLQVFPSNGLSADSADQVVTLASAPGRRMVFAWSPDGERIAYAVQKRGDAAFYGPVHVFDLDTGQSRPVTNAAFDISAFFWSPDGRRLGYLSRLTLPASVWMQWRVYDVAGDRDRGFAAFHPSPLMQFMIHSFNQYAQSHRFWSPDSRYLVYADRDRALVDRVWLVDTWAEKGTDPRLVDEESIGVWSWK